jgi:hypothetical protein
MRRTVKVLVVLRNKHAAPQPQAEPEPVLLAVEPELLQVQAIPVVSLFGREIPVSSEWTWAHILEPVFGKREVVR